MPLENGARLGHYEVISPIGAGGMGEVYKARDPRLNRTVAIKVLPAHITERAELRERFEREARAIAAFNHPHICVVHDVGWQDEIDFLVMEYLEGETLADRIARGPLPFDQIVTYGTQIADALDKAHRHGVTHRDLKPGNIMLTKAGVKLLDFGLAKVQEPVATFGSASIVPTIATAAPQPLTVQGTILGTLQYMAPEQLEGKEADARSDIFAFGAVLYEMATGRRAFEGKSHVSLMAAILEHDPPPVSSLQKLSPPRFDDIVRISLAKNPDERWQSAADLVHELKLLVQYGNTPAATSKGASRRERILWGAALAAAVIAGVGAHWAASIREQPTKVSFEVRANIGGVTNPLMFALSPDGRNLVALVQEADRARLWLRPTERVTGVSLKGTEGFSRGTPAAHPFWSPDGRRIGFFADRKLKTIDVSGAPPQTLADAPAARGGTWNRNGVILFAPEDGGPLFRVAAAGGERVQVTELDKSRRDTAHRHPRFLPDGVHFLYTVTSAKPEFSGIYVGALDSKEAKRLGPGTSQMEFVQPDLVLFTRENTLMAQRFDIGRLELSGDPFQVAENVPTIGAGLAGFSASRNGALAYRTGDTAGSRRLIWFSREGEIEGSVWTPAVYQYADLSPDGKRLAVFKPDGGGDIWITELERAINTKFTFDPASDMMPVWSHEGKQIAFVSNRKGGVFNIYVKASNGIGEDQVLLETPNNKAIWDWSADGRFIVYEEIDPTTKRDLWALPLTGDRKPMRLLSTPADEYAAAFSPDGRWVAYASNESGSYQVYVQGFPEPRGRWQISTGAATATFPRWSRDGKELFYDSSGELMAVDVTGTAPGGGFKAGTPRELFSGLRGLGGHNFDVSPDGRRFIVISEGLETSSAPIVVVLNWMSGIAR
jgi:Tol biopolymer transport system component/tRNA A-37 threonylcarbamoyl transferase component Bud32